VTPKSQRFIVDDGGRTITFEDIKKDIPESAGCKRIISVSRDLLTVCETTDGLINIRGDRGRTPLYSLRVPKGEIIVSAVWSVDGSRLHILSQKSASSNPDTSEVLNSNDAELGTTSRIVTIDLRFNRQIDDRVLLGAVLQITPSRDGGIFYASFDFTKLPLETQVRHLNIQTGVDKKIYATGGTLQTSRIAVSPDEKTFLFAVDQANRRWDDFTNLMLIDTQTGKEIRSVSGNMSVNSGSWYGWGDDGKTIYFSARQGGADVIAAVGQDEKISTLTDDKVSRRRIAISANYKFMAYETESLSGDRDIRTLSLETLRENRVLIIDSLKAQFQLSETKTVWWRSRDNRSIAGFLILPFGYQKEKRYPMIVDVHGGGRGQRLVMAAPLTIATSPGPGEWFAWAALGYVVFVPDYRSSGSYGPISPKIATCCNDGIVAEDAADVLDGIDALIAQGLVASDRVGLLGHSAGGARVIELLAGKRHFAAAVVNEAVAPDPLFNFINMARGRATGTDVLERLTPDGISKPLPEQLLDGTTLLSAYRSRTPTLVMVGNETKGATSNLTGELLFTLLKNKGTETRLVRFNNDGHVLSTPESVRRGFLEVRNWFDRHLKSK
jgi:dipeptidyl aminopeptidase/acylaminoacyl peptidase